MKPSNSSSNPPDKSRRSGGGGVDVVRKLLLFIATVLLFGCTAFSRPVVEGPPSSQAECVDGCLDTYSPCLIECDKTVVIGPKLDLCYQQCKEHWAECKEDCARVGNSQ